MKSVHIWLNEYSRSHQHPVNKLIHCVCIPLILFSLLGILWQIEPFSLTGGLSYFSNLAVVFLLPILVYYLFLNWKLAIGMACVSVIILGLLVLLEGLKIPLSTWIIYLVVFIFAWIFQFAGHIVEGKHPSFIQDIQFILIGPLWLLAFVYRKLNVKY